MLAARKEKKFSKIYNNKRERKEFGAIRGLCPARCHRRLMANRKVNPHYGHQKDWPGKG